LTLPRSSQRSRTTQRIGITDITIDYHRPLVGGRKIFGGLLAYGQVWRAGANENTIIEFSDPVGIEGQALAKGIYGLHMIPGETSWVIIFSKNVSSWGSFSYDKAEDALRVTGKPQTIENEEALTYDFDNPKPDSAVVTMPWERSLCRSRLRSTPQKSSSRACATSFVAACNLNGLHGRKPRTTSWITNSAQKKLRNTRTIPSSSKTASKLKSPNLVRLPLLAAIKRRSWRATEAISMATQQQVHDFGRGLQFKGRQDEALDLFRANIKKDPNTWVAHNEAARIAVAKGDFDTAIKEMKLAASLSPEALKAQHLDIVRRLEDKQDIKR
jgi:Protein of unknown function (DUF2911)